MIFFRVLLGHISKLQVHIFNFGFMGILHRAIHYVFILFCQDIDFNLCKVQLIIQLSMLLFFILYYIKR